jgi:hypothetical protein
LAAAFARVTTIVTKAVITAVAAATTIGMTTEVQTLIPVASIGDTVTRVS